MIRRDLGRRTTVSSSPKSSAVTFYGRERQPLLTGVSRERRKTPNLRAYTTNLLGAGRSSERNQRLRA